MFENTPTSLKLFLITGITTIIVFLIATFYPGYGVTLAFILTMVFAVSAVGIYSGLKSKFEQKKVRRRNRVGLFGNLAITLFILGIMVFAYLSM